MNGTNGRNVHLTKIAGGLRAQGHDAEEIFNRLMVHPERNELPEVEVQTIARSVCKYPPGEPQNVSHGRQTVGDEIDDLCARRQWTREALEAFGATSSGGLVSIPMRDASGKQVSTKFRKRDNTKFAGGAKSICEKGKTTGLIYSPPLADNVAVLVCEGEADAVAARSAGYLTVVATPGAQVGKKPRQALQKLLAGRKCILSPHPDEAGRDWARVIGNLLRNAQCEASFIPPDKDKDLDERLRLESDRTSALMQWAQAALPWKSPRKDPAPEVLDGNGKVVPLQVARAIRKDRHIVNIGGDFYEYLGGVYRKREAWHYKREATELIGDKSRKAGLADIMELLAVETAVEQSAVYNNGGVVNLAYGLLDVDTRELKPHTPELISTIQIPIEHDPDAGCESWFKALADWFPDDQETIDLVQDFFGYALTRDVRQHKALILYGEGANGKSVLCETLKALVGPENVSAVSLNAMGKSFSLAELFGKLVNLTIEGEVRDQFEEAVFKQIISGDILMAERKYRDPFTFNPFCKIVIATNNLPPVRDRSDGFYRRLLIVRFERQFEPSEQDKDLLANIADEMPGVLNWALDGLERLQERGSFLVPERVEDEVKEYRRFNNPVSTWVSECCDVYAEAWTDTATLYKRYKEWAVDAGHKPMAKNKFSHDLRRVGGVDPQQHPQTRARGYSGIQPSLN